MSHRTTSRKQAAQEARAINRKGVDRDVGKSTAYFNNRLEHQYELLRRRMQNKYVSYKD